MFLRVVDNLHLFGRNFLPDLVQMLLHSAHVIHLLRLLISLSPTYHEYSFLSGFTGVLTKLPSISRPTSC